MTCIILNNRSIQILTADVVTFHFLEQSFAETKAKSEGQHLALATAKINQFC